MEWWWNGGGEVVDKWWNGGGEVVVRWWNSGGEKRQFQNHPPKKSKLFPLSGVGGRSLLKG